MSKGNFKVVCVKARTSSFTEGKTYKIVDGELADDDGYIHYKGKDGFVDIDSLRVLISDFKLVKTKKKQLKERIKELEKENSELKSDLTYQTKMHKANREALMTERSKLVMYVNEIKQLKSYIENKIKDIVFGKSCLDEKEVNKVIIDLLKGRIHRYGRQLGVCERADIISELDRSLVRLNKLEDKLNEKN